MALTALNRKAIAAGMIGNIMEWYDFAVYGFMAPVFAKMFFPADDPVSSLIAAYGAFAAGYLMRPIGGALFGYIGDRFGRKKALVYSVVMMALPTFFIGLLPTQETLGVAAAVLVVALRMAQGLAVGGELPTAIVFLAERAPEGRRGFFACWGLFGAVGGILLGSAVCAIVTDALHQTDFHGWGWRLPFLIGIVLAFVGFYLRIHLKDDPIPKASKAGRGPSPVMAALKYHWRPILHLSTMNLANAITFYGVFIYTVSWLVSYVQEPRSEALNINTLAMVILMAFILLGGYLADKVGRKPVMLIAAAGLMVLAYPLVWLMHHPDFWLILLAQSAFAVLLAFYASALAVAMTEMFPRQVRISSVSIGYNLTQALFGGTAPMVAVWLISRSHDDLAFAWYLSAAALVSLIAVAMLSTKTSFSD